MKNLYEPSTLEEILERINKLDPSSERQWGKMEVAQMMAHCSAALEVAAGQKFPPRMFIGRILGPFIKSVFTNDKPLRYSTTSMLRTMELILGIPPMTQYDAAATPMWRSFSNVADTTSFVALPANVDINEKNVASNEWQRRSENFNLAKEDAVPDLEFNIVLWHAIKGDHIPFPGPKRAAFVKLKDEKDEDDID